MYKLKFIIIKYNNINEQILWIKKYLIINSFKINSSNIIKNKNINIFISIKNHNIKIEFNVIDNNIINNNIGIIKYIIKKFNFIN